MNANSDDVTGVYAVDVQWLQRLLDERCGRPYAAGVAAPSTNSQRDVMTPTPKDSSLGFTRWMVIAALRA